MAVQLDCSRLTSCSFSCELGTATSALVATGLGSDAGVVDLAQVEAFAASTPRLE